MAQGYNSPSDGDRIPPFVSTPFACNQSFDQHNFQNLERLEATTCVPVEIQHTRKIGQAGTDGLPLAALQLRLGAFNYGKSLLMTVCLPPRNRLT